MWEKSTCKERTKPECAKKKMRKFKLTREFHNYGIQIKFVTKKDWNSSVFFFQKAAERNEELHDVKMKQNSPKDNYLKNMKKYHDMKESEAKWSQPRWTVLIGKESEINFPDFAYFANLNLHEYEFSSPNREYRFCYKLDDVLWILGVFYTNEILVFDVIHDIND